MKKRDIGRAVHIAQANFDIQVGWILEDLIQHTCTPQEAVLELKAALESLDMVHLKVRLKTHDLSTT